MTKISETINDAESARQAGNLGLAIKLLIGALREIDAGRRRITPDQVGEAIKARREGHDARETAAQLGIAETRVRRIWARWDRLYPGDFRRRS